MTNKVALEKNIDNILKCAHIADSDEVLTVHELSRINHPNAPSATDKPEPDPAPSVANDPEITTTKGTSSSSSSYHGEAQPAQVRVNDDKLIFDSIDYSFVESSVPIEDSTNPLVLKTLLQSISNGLQDCVHKELEALSSKPTTTSTSASATTPSLPTTVPTTAANTLSYEHSVTMLWTHLLHWMPP
jgi:hypothetical protein